MRVTVIRGRESGLILALELVPEEDADFEKLQALTDEIDYQSALIANGLVERLVISLRNKALL